MKKFASAFMSFIMLFALTAPAFAAEPDPAVIEDSSTVTTETPLQIMPQNVQSLNLQNVGDTHILMEDEDGFLIIELIDEYVTRSNISRAGITVGTSKVYNIYHKDWLGREDVAVKITASVTWVNNGADSYIKNLHGECDIKNDDFSCEWDDNFKKSSDVFHELVLNVRHENVTRSYMLTAILVYTDAACTVPSVDLDIGEMKI